MWLAPSFILCTDFYDEEPEKKRHMENPYWDSDGRDEIKDKEWYWKNKHLSKCMYMHGDEEVFMPQVYVRVPAPMEKQLYPEYINCEEFTVWRKQALDAVSKYKDPRTHGFLAQLNIPWPHPCAIHRENSEGSEYEAEIHLGHRLYKPTLMSWLNKTKSDIEFQEYFSASPEENKDMNIEIMLQIGKVDFDEDKKVYSGQPKPKLWLDEYIHFCEDDDYGECAGAELVFETRTGKFLRDTEDDDDGEYDELRHN